MQHDPHGNHYHRRGFLALALKGTALATVALTGWLRPMLAWARNSAAFSAETETDALAELFPGRTITATDRITIDVHELVENGAFVPVAIETSLDGVTSISVLADKNPNPLLAKFNLAPACEGFIATRLKVADPSNIIIVVEAGDKLYSARKFVEVVAGGCG